MNVYYIIYTTDNTIYYNKIFTDKNNNKVYLITSMIYVRRKCSIVYKMLFLQNISVFCGDISARCR